MGKNTVIVFLIFVATLVSVGNFTSTPGFWFDEGIVAGISKSIVEHGVYGTAVAPGQFETHNFWISVNYPVTLPVALAIKIFGVGIWQARLPLLLYLLLFILVSYALIRRLYSSRDARWATLLLITFAPLYGNGKAVLGEVPGLFWLLFGVWQYIRFVETKHTRWLVGASLAAGLAVATKPFYVLLLPSFIYLLVHGYRTRFLNCKKLLVAMSVFVLPLVIWFYFTIGFSILTNFKPTFSYLVNSYAADSFRPTIGNNLLRFVRESTPLHFTFLVCIILSAAWKRRREGLVGRPVETALLIFGIVAWVWYLKTPGWYRYFFSIHVLAILFFPTAARALFGRVASLVLVSLFIFQSIHLYRNYNAFSSHEVMEVVAYLEKNATPQASIFVVSRPEITFLLRRDNVSQSIFINRRLSIGSSISSAYLTDYIVSGRDDSQFLTDYRALLEHDYELDTQLGHTHIYRRK